MESEQIKPAMDDGEYTSIWAKLRKNGMSNKPSAKEVYVWCKDFRGSVMTKYDFQTMGIVLNDFFY